MLWDRLTKFTSKHRRFADTKWALNDELFSPIELVAGKLASSSPLNLYQHLFSDWDFDLYEENGSWKEPQKKLELRRQTAVEEILKLGNIEAVIQFAGAVKFPDQVGDAFGCATDVEVDKVLLPAYLEAENHSARSL